MGLKCENEDQRKPEDVLADQKKTSRNLGRLVGTLTSVTAGADRAEQLADGGSERGRNADWSVTDAVWHRLERS